MDLTDPALDDVKVEHAGHTRTVAELVSALREHIASDASLDEAGATLDFASAAMLDLHARWMDILPSLRAVLSPPQLLQLCARALEGAYGGRDISPSAPMFETLLTDGGEASLPWAAGVCDAALAGTLPSTLSSIAASAAMVLVGTRDPEPLLALADFYSSAEAKRALLEAASPEARARWIHSFLAVAQFAKRDNGGRFVGARIERLLPLIDLCREGGARAHLDEALRAAGDHPAVVDARQALDNGAARPTPDRRAINAAAVEYVRAESAKRRRGLEVPALFQQAADRAVPIADARELADVADWIATSDERRRAIAERVARALGDSFELKGFERFADARLPVAVYHHDGARYHLVPGATFEMGLSHAEEGILRAAAAKAEAEGIENWYEEHGALLEHLDEMRPIRAVRLRPFLVAQAPSGVVSLAAIADALEATRFRLLSEAEREYVARGGQPARLTPLGDDVPGVDALDALEAPTGAFGLVALGLYPEVCADSDHSGYAGAPVDGTPRRGGRPLVVRGGASWVYPWQACGEWQLLCCAVRGNTLAWDDQAAARWALGIDV